MQIKITNTNYSYLGEGLLSFSATVEMRDDADILLNTSSISTRTRTTSPGWAEAAIAELINQAQSHVDEYVKVMTAMQSKWPAASTPSEIMDLIAVEIEGGIK